MGSRKTRLVVAILAIAGLASLAAQAKPANAAPSKVSVAQVASTEQIADVSDTASTAECPISYNHTAFSGGPVFGWEHYNVDPYYPNVTDLTAYRHFVASAKGRSAAARLGIPYAKLKQVTPCAGWLTKGEHLAKMLSGGFWSPEIKLDRNVKVDFIGNKKQEKGPVRAWYAPVRVGNTVYVFVVPFLCGNAGEIITFSPQRHVAKKPVWLIKDVVDADNHVFPTPTGTFQFRAKINGHTSYPVYNHPPRQLIGYCIVGSRPSVTELTPHSNESWKLLSPAKPYLSELCTRKGAVFTFKNQEVQTAPVFYGTISKKVENVLDASQYANDKVTFHVSINGVPSFDEFVPINALVYGLGRNVKNGVVPLHSGDVVQACLDQASDSQYGLTVDGSWCQTQTVNNANLVFSFVDTPVTVAKTTPPGSPSTSTTQKCDPGPGCVPPAPTPPGSAPGSSQNPPDTPPGQSSAPTGGDTNQCQDPNNPFGSNECQTPSG